MNPIKKKLANFLYEMSKKSMNAMDPESPCARSLKNLDRDALLKKDIQNICDEIGILETGKILSLFSKLMLSSIEDADKYKKEIELIAYKVVKRVEDKPGILNLPPECRDFLLKL